MKNVISRLFHQGAYIESDKQVKIIYYEILVVQ